MDRHRAGIAGDQIRAGLQGRTGRSFWRSLEELSDSPAFADYLAAEFPSLAPVSGGVDRRSLLRAMAASLALAGLTGCSGEPDEAALPYVTAPEFVVPGKPKWYATAVTMAGYAQPVLGKTHVGRPVKLEGNPDHPATHGATDPFLQAAILGLYDPDRSQAPRHLGRVSTWDAFDATMVARAAEIQSRRGDGFRLLTGTVTSPTLARQISAMMARWPQARWHVLEPVNDDLRRQATADIFGRPLDLHLALDEAEVVVSIDDDLLGPGPRQAVHARRWSMRRAAYQNGEGECRWFVAEPTPSITGSVAEDRLVSGPMRLPVLVQALAAAFAVEGITRPDLTEREARWVDTAVAAINRHTGRSLVTVGAQLPPALQALGLLINERLGSFGGTVKFSEPVAVVPPDGAGSMRALVEDMAAGRVTTLAMLDVNPAYATPADLAFRDALRRVDLRIHAGLHNDETASLSHWHLPIQHELETWSDGRAVDGSVSILQPLIKPFYAVRSMHAVLGNLLGQGINDREIVQATWQQAWGDAFAARWRDALLKGFVAGSAAPFLVPAVVTRAVSAATPEAARGLAVVFRADPTLWDGRFANNGWLQETPKPLTKITWGNAILISPRLAAELAIVNGDEVKLSVAGRDCVGAAWILPGQDAGTITVTFGYGRSRAGRVADGLGYDAFSILASDNQGPVTGATLTKTGNRQTIATTQLHQAMDGFDFVRTVPAGARTARAEPQREDEAKQPSFYPQRAWDSPSWGMSIDLDACIGCNACVVACVAENNIPVVGKELVAQGREMHWLRVDHYHEGDADEPKSYFQPVPCMHCEQAPCEMGCPVNATVHSSDGLNLQVYNRCIGTRTCSSYCPYKVRRFNWFDYTGDDPPSLKAMRNPDVTVRDRGVMEKCTYCVQRISEARIAAKIEGRPIRDGEVVTACQQACPTQAISFGDVTDPTTAVSRRKAGSRDYTLLEEVNTRPRTTYLARIESAPSGDQERDTE